LPGGERRAADIVGTDIIHKGDIRLTVDAHHRDLLRNALVDQRFRRLPGGDDNPGDAKLGKTAQRAGQILLAANFAHQRLKTATLDLAKQSISRLLRNGSLMRETITPIRWLRRRLSPGREINLIASSSAARNTRSRVSGEILPLLLSARETTARETPARWATSCAVTLCLRGRRSCRAFLAVNLRRIQWQLGRHD
jgi:hypothetical protein